MFGNMTNGFQICLVLEGEELHKLKTFCYTYIWSACTTDTYGS